ncbi:hypothetical protein [Endozoicomonas sp. SESOKO1]|uniref:hypothetical protein n=1 Tax=Endozoicomonas sp. SESOKO1 TaxID=2828742 RepID=UPI002147444B|nr:hypothetical protein [Endozoicomonas sp. SESOKO1]
MPVTECMPGEAQLERYLMLLKAHARPQSLLGQRAQRKENMGAAAHKKQCMEVVKVAYKQQWMEAPVEQKKQWMKMVERELQDYLHLLRQVLVSLYQAVSHYHYGSKNTQSHTRQVLQ